MKFRFGVTSSNHEIAELPVETRVQGGVA